MTIKNLKKLYGIGLTGGIATGKSTVATILRELGFIVIDADLLARQAVSIGSSGLKRIVAEFGREFLNPDSTLNRKKLSEHVFANPLHLKRLEAMTHPEIENLLDQQLESEGLLRAPKTWFYEAALIFETGKETCFREVWATYCPEPVQIARLMARDSINEVTARRLIANQMPAIEKENRADFCILTSGSVMEIREAVIKALRDRKCM